MKNGISNFLTSHPDLEIGEIRISEQLGGQTIEEYSELFLNFVGEPNMLIWQIFPLLIRTNIRIHVFKDFSVIIYIYVYYIIAFGNIGERRIQNNKL